MVDQTLFDRNVMIMKAEDSCGNVSDGDHTFNELYYHRMVLFAALVNANSANAWKSKLHDDGTMFDGYFIVGLNTPEGNVTYHYPMEYWHTYKCKEVERAPKWDGHTPEIAINRILNNYV